MKIVNKMMTKLMKMKTIFANFAKQILKHMKTFLNTTWTAIHAVIFTGLRRKYCLGASVLDAN